MRAARKPALPIVRWVPKAAPVTVMPLSRRQRIVKAACLMFGVTLEEFRGPRRSWAAVAARTWAATRLKDEIGLSSGQIGAIMDRDHTTVLHLFRRARGFDKAGRPRLRPPHVYLFGPLPREGRT